jgi:hypothetical protein
MTCDTREQLLSTDINVEHLAHAKKCKYSVIVGMQGDADDL